jgi:hypothetical protein
LQKRMEAILDDGSTLDGKFGSWELVHKMRQGKDLSLTDSEYVGNPHAVPDWVKQRWDEAGLGKGGKQDSEDPRGQDSSEEMAMRMSEDFKRLVEGEAAVEKEKENVQEEGETMSNEHHKDVLVPTGKDIQEGKFRKDDRGADKEKPSQKGSDGVDSTAKIGDGSLVLGVEGEFKKVPTPQQILDEFRSARSDEQVGKDDPKKMNTNVWGKWEYVSETALPKIQNLDDIPKEENKDVQEIKRERRDMKTVTEEVVDMEKGLVDLDSGEEEEGEKRTPKTKEVKKSIGELFRKVDLFRHIRHFPELQRAAELAHYDLHNDPHVVEFNHLINNLGARMDVRVNYLTEFNSIIMR